MWVIVIFALVLGVLTFTGNDKANFNCEGSIDNENSSLYLRLVLFTWWNPISLFRGDFLDGRAGNAFVTVNEGKLKSKNQGRVRYELKEQNPYLQIRKTEYVTYGTLAYLDQKQQLTGLLEGYDIEMRCFVAHSLYWF